MSARRCWLAIVAAAAVWADEGTDIKINGWGWLNFGRVGSGYNQQEEGPEKDIDFSKEWLEDFSAGIRAERCFTKTFKAHMHVGVSTKYIVDNPELLSYEFWKRGWAVYLVDAAIEKAVTISDVQSLLLEFGYFPVRYNPEAANLGEYLFRSTPYPTVIESGFELADKEKLTGLHAGYKLDFLDKSFLEADLYLSSAMRHIPIFDFSPALVLAANLQNFVEAGAGVQLFNLISVDETKTTPGKDPFRITVYPERVVYIDPTPLDTIMITKDTLMYPEDTQLTTITRQWILRDTTFYTFRGIKAMGRITLNPRALIPSEALGPEDLKIFAEVAILGLKNYRAWYEDIADRIPIMFGINLPAFKLLDILSLQFQYFKNPYWNTWEYEWKNGSPVPYQGLMTGVTYEQYLAGLADPDDRINKEIHEDDWKWSLYASRKIGKHLRLSLQFANDNLFKTKYMPPPPSQSKYTEVMRQTWMKDANGKEIWGKVCDWYWMAKMMFYF
ncbi:MAG: hypothetical protein JXA18_03695 [Chitinispirillaceae bacterium]|nr:hypothetical protein [Chitinispirillaceae bacterium]